MKFVIASLLLVAGFLALSSVEASAVVCARGRVQGWLRRARRRCGRRTSCCRTTGDRCAPQGVLIISR
jgi:hypothetical protein